MIRKILLVCLLVLTGHLLLGQSRFERELDSLQKVMAKTVSDTQRVNLLHKSAGICLNYSNPKRALVYLEKATKILEPLDWDKGLAFNHHFRGIVSFYSGDYDKSLKENEKALALRKKTNDLQGLATSYGNIGLIYQVRADYPMALKYQILGLKAEEKLKNEDGIGASYTNIGLIFEHLGDYEKAKSYYLKSLKIRERIKDTFNMARTYSNLGNVYYSLKNLEKALEQYRISLALTQRSEDINGSGIALANIGNMYYEKGQYDTALSYQLKCLEIVEQTGDMRVWLTVSCNIADIYIIQGHLDWAAPYVERALHKAREMKTPDIEMTALATMAMLYEKRGEWKMAQQTYKQYIAIRDTLSNEERNKEVARKEIQYEFDKREEKRKLLAREKSRKQQIIIYSVSLGLLLVVIFSIFIFRSLRANKKKNKIIQEQKTLVEEKQKEILDSINYARKIQYALLAHDDLLKQNLPEHFVLFKPKDIVSGDFYWGTTKVSSFKSQVSNSQVETMKPETCNTFYLAVCDSTGHGVPGAFMSLLNISFLNEAINEKGIEAPNEVFNHVRKRLIENVSHEGAQDGMDATLVKFQRSDSITQMEYAAAYNAPLIIRQGEIVECPCDKMPIGKGESISNFKLHTVPLQKGDMLYLYTDGYADQFGGDKGKKYKESNLKKLFQHIHTLPTHEQKTKLSQELVEWMTDHEQIDDICIIGIRL